MIRTKSKRKIIKIFKFIFYTLEAELQIKPPLEKN